MKLRSLFVFMLAALMLLSLFSCAELKAQDDIGMNSGTAGPVDGEGSAETVKGIDEGEATIAGEAGGTTQAATTTYDPEPVKKIVSVDGGESFTIEGNTYSRSSTDSSLLYCDGSCWKEEFVEVNGQTRRVHFAMEQLFRGDVDGDGVDDIIFINGNGDQLIGKTLYIYSGRTQEELFWSGYSFFRRFIKNDKTNTSVTPFAILLAFVNDEGELLIVERLSKSQEFEELKTTHTYVYKMCFDREAGEVVFPCINIYDGWVGYDGN